MYRIQAVLVLFMAVASLLGYLLLPSKNSARTVALQPASSVQPAACHTSDTALRQKEHMQAVREKVRIQLQNIPRYRELFKTSPRAAFIVDRENESDWLVYVGENTDWHFQLRDTLRVSKNGRVDELRPNGEWQPLSR